MTEILTATTITYAIREVRREAHGWNGEGVFAAVELTDGSSLMLSHLDDEPAGRWVADGSFGPGSFPRWCHGFGSRCTMLRVVDDRRLIADLDARAAALTPA